MKNINLVLTKQTTEFHLAILQIIINDHNMKSGEAACRGHEEAVCQNHKTEQLSHYTAQKKQAPLTA